MSVIAVDFDGTLCKERWPKIGAPNFLLIRWLIERKAAGDKVILWTCRCGEMLEKAVLWCESMGLTFDAVNANLPENVEKYGNDCRKIFADIYLDDKAGYIARISPFPTYVRPKYEHPEVKCWTAKG